MNDSILERLELLEKAVALLATQQLEQLSASADDLLVMGSILEMHDEIIDALVEASDDLELIVPEEEEEPKSATILKLVVDNTKDEE
jgi:hypothetical protein